ncbi:MAG: hypothetical protein KTR31_34510 [Myxococcales bacterium]|nr:hypothetical protein [Myxococcales bacterium]
MLPLILVAQAALATPVVHEGPSEQALATVRERLGEGAYEPVSIDLLRRGAPALVSGGVVQACQGQAVALPDVQATLSEVQQALMFLELEAARSGLDALGDQVLCVAGAEQVPAATLAEIAVLDGIHHELSGAPQVALARFRAAVGHDPEVPWNEAFPAERRVRFDEAKAEAAPGEVAMTVVPSGPVVVDGRARVGEQTQPGERVVARADVVVRVQLAPAVDDTLVLPGAFPSDSLGWIASEERRAELTALLAQGLGEGVPAIVVRGDTAWRGTTGRVDWTTYAPQEALPPRKRRRWAPVVVVGGVALAAAGGILTGITQRQLDEVVVEYQALDPNDPEYMSDYGALKSEFEGKLPVWGTGVGLIGAGVGLAGLGVTFTLGGKR